MLGSHKELPQTGMLAVLRNRRGIISSVNAFDSHDGRYHLVRVDYRDESLPSSEEVLWELEPYAKVLQSSELPKASAPPMREDFFPMLCSARWTAMNPYLDPDGSGPLDRLPIRSPFHGAVEVEDYQLIPLLKALRMPRVNLMIADDVGLGKTVEAGLIISELLIRRRVNRILVLTPASLRVQWKDELWSKFSMPFDVVDRDFTLKLKRRIGIDANPWRSCSRVIASYHYLKQPDILEQFHSASRTEEGSPHLPWDLLIVDEVHNLLPAAMGEDSELCKMLRQIAPLFEHRIFLTATPHNGHTASFTGLLEILDPVRFTKTSELAPAERERVKQIVIRRLKREINQRTNPPKFSNRKSPQSLNLDPFFAEAELNLMSCFEVFRRKVRDRIASSTKKRKLAGNFAIEILGKRMLSGPMTFLESWQRCKAGLSEENSVDDNEALSAAKTSKQEIADDLEAQQRDSAVSEVIGAWMRSFADEMVNEIRNIDLAAAGMGITLDAPISRQTPTNDARYNALCQLIESLLRNGNSWKDDERLIVFTEYKTTLDYLLWRLRDQYDPDGEGILSLYGGMSNVERELVKDSFNNPDHAVRILVATDAASEGLNLQSTARYLLHYDCPWNPSRLEQRNGRLDRHGQARDVSIFHFASTQDADLNFVGYVIRKVDQVREDLGATGDLFDEATHRMLVRGEKKETVVGLLDEQIALVRQSTQIDADTEVFDESGTAKRQLEAMAKEVDFNPSTAKDTLETAMAIGVGRPQLSTSDDFGRFSFSNPGLRGWKELIDESLRKQTASGSLSALPKMSFSVDPFIENISGRKVFRPRLDTVMLHLGHPLMQKATGELVRRRFPGPNSVSRWTARYGTIPNGADALIVLHLEEIAVNELRETFHHWVDTQVFPVKENELLPNKIEREELRSFSRGAYVDSAGEQHARDLIEDVENELRDIVKAHRQELSKKLRVQLGQDANVAFDEENRRYQSRQAEVSKLIHENTLSKLEKDLSMLRAKSQQGMLFETDSYFDQLDREIKIKQEELERRTIHYEEVREQLSRERDRITKRLLPRRYSMSGEAHVFPVALEVILPGGNQ